MASYLAPPIYAAFIWWFSTGVVLLLVGLSKRFDGLRGLAASGLLVGSIFGLASACNDLSVGGAYAAFTATILLWGAQEITFLAGWITGPRGEPCPADAKGWRRFGLALQAILYHELILLASGAAILAITWQAPNQVALWTFATLWVLRQSSKINLFLGVPVTNDELMPDAVSHLKSYFARKSVGVFFPISVTLSTAALVILIQRVVEVAATPFDTVGFTLVSTLFALGILEHWFMLLPLPAMTLWGWGIQSRPSSDTAIFTVPEASGTLLEHRPITQITNSPSKSPARKAEPLTLALSLVSDNSSPRCARQRLEEQFRQTFIEQHSRSDLGPARRSGAESATTVNGRTT